MKVMYRDSDCKVAHIIVSHGSVVKSFAQFASNCDSRGVNALEKVNYCGVAAISIVKNKFRLTMDGNNKHLHTLNEKAENLLREWAAKEERTFENHEFDQQ